MAQSTARLADAIQPRRRPLLTLALPTYNRAGYLDRFFTHHIEAFTARGIDFEILVSDNCSTDETPDIVARWAANEPRIRPVRQPHNIGVHGNFLFTWMQSRGEFAVWVGDDDLLVPDAVVDYICRMQASPDLVMVQAPWMLIDESRDNAEMGTFYQLRAEKLFRRGEHARCLDFLLEGHVFPEWFILRTDAAPDVIEPPNSFAFHYFAHLARALTVGSVLFAPRPFARVTAISKGDNNHSGNRETMDGWDRFRGGIEYFASCIDPDGPDALDMAAMLPRIQDFTLKRMAVAANLHVAAGNWSTAYHLERRMRCYGRQAVHPDMRPVVAGLAAIEAMIAEATLQGCDHLVLDDMIADDTLEGLRPELRTRIIRRRDPRAADASRKAFALLRPPAVERRRADDLVIDLAAAFRRCPP